MNLFTRVLMAMFLLLLLGAATPSAEEHCASVSDKGRFFTLSVNRKLDTGTGDWIRTFTAQNTDSEKPSDDIVLEATHSNVECQGRNVVRLEVVVRELKRNLSSQRKPNEFLTFHKRHGKNVMVIHEGRTAQKLDPDDKFNAVLFTNRPLRTEEIFEIRLEEKIKKWNVQLGIGVVSFSPDVEKIIPETWRRNQTWMMHHNHLYGSNTEMKSNIGKKLDTLEVNDRVGVMRRADGELHFYINGVDQGSAAVVPEGVYGVLELWHDATRARIVYS